VSPSLAFLVPGALDQLTGGYLFDRRVVEGLRAAGREVRVVELPGAYPEPDAAARAAMEEALAALPAASAAVIDGLALPGAADYLAAAAARLRLVGFIHHPLAAETGLSVGAARRLAALERRLIPLLHGALCPSRTTAAALADYGLAPARIAVTPPGTAKPKAVPQRPHGEGPVQLLCVATVTPRKGHLLLVEALAGLRDLDWRLLCLGSLERAPDTVAALCQAIARHDLGGRVTLAGEWPPERLGAAYGEAELFALPSFHEGYGMAFAEALAWGLPVVGARAGAVPELVPETAGILVAPGDTAALAAALRRLIADPALRRRLAEGALQAGAALPSWADSVRHWGEAVDRLVAA
jgi:glycosyltransferase involved in cell wall biosynthesis